MKKKLRKIHKTIDQYPVIVFEDEKRGYWVSCPVLQGCYSQGETIDEALSNIREAIALCKEESSEKVASHQVSLHFVQV